MDRALRQESLRRSRLRPGRADTLCAGISNAHEGARCGCDRYRHVFPIHIREHSPYLCWSGFSIWRFLVYIREEILIVLGTSSSDPGRTEPDGEA